MNADWDKLTPVLIQSIWQTLHMVTVSLIIGGIAGLIIGLGLYATRKGNLYQNKVVFGILNIAVNIIRPIPFIIFLTAIGPVTLAVTGTIIGTTAAIFPMAIMAAFVSARLVEQNLVTVDPGVVEAARSMGASRIRIIFTVVIPEALAPLILGYTFLLVGVIDMSAMAGYIGGGGLGDFAIVYGYQRFQWEVTIVALVIIVVMVQIAQTLGNWLAKKLLRH